MADVVSLAGEPDRDIGSGIHILEYRLEDGSLVWVGTPGDRVLYVRHGQVSDIDAADQLLGD